MFLSIFARTRLQMSWHPLHVVEERYKCLHTVDARAFAQGSQLEGYTRAVKSMLLLVLDPPFIIPTIVPLLLIFHLLTDHRDNYQEMSLGQDLV